MACNRTSLLGGRTTLDCLCEIYPNHERCADREQTSPIINPIKQMAPDKAPTDKRPKKCYDFNEELHRLVEIPCKESNLRADKIRGLLKISTNVYAGKAKYPQAFRVWIMRSFGGENKWAWDNPRGEGFIPSLKAIRDAFRSSYYSKDFSSSSPKAKMMKVNGFLKDRVDEDVLDDIMRSWGSYNSSQEPREGDGKVSVDININEGEARDLASALDVEYKESEQLGLFDRPKDSAEYVEVMGLDGAPARMPRSIIDEIDRKRKKYEEQDRISFEKARNEPTPWEDFDF